MDSKIIVIIALFLCAITILLPLNKFGISQIVSIPLVLIGFSLLFFSRGILIFLTVLCLVLAQSPFPKIESAGLFLRWVFFALFSLHVFGDIFLGRTVRNIKIFDVLAIVFVIYALLSSFYSPFPILSRQRAMTVLFLYISVFWIIWKYAYDEGPEKVVYLILRATILIFILSYLMIFASPSLVFLSGRFQGIFQNPNSVGITCAILLPLSLWHFLETKKRTALFLFFLMLVALFLSASRNAINATTVAMLYFIYLSSRKYRLSVFLVSLALILMVSWSIQILATHLFQVYYRTETISTIGGRIEVWPYAWDLIRERPIFGYGFGVEDRILSFKYIVFKKPPPGGYMHNSYLGMMLQLGIVGFIILYSPLFILLFKELSLTFKELYLRQDSKTPTLRYALQASFISGLLCCIFESWIYSVGNAQAFPFWVIIMLLVFYADQDKEKNIPEGT